MIRVMVQQGQTLLIKAASAESEYTAMVREFMTNPLPSKPPI